MLLFHFFVYFYENHNFNTVIAEKKIIFSDFLREKHGFVLISLNKGF